MAWVLKAMLMASYVQFMDSSDVEPPEKKAAQIAVTVMDPATHTAFNTSYMFGIYGMHSLTDPASGELVHVRSEGGVNHGCSSYNQVPPTHNWVALTERGTCYFSDKVRLATKQYNASAVIVYDNSPTDHLIVMQSSVNDEVHLFVTQSFGRRLALLVDGGLLVQVNITASDVPLSSSLVHVASPSIVVSLLAAGCLLLCLAL